MWSGGLLVRRGACLAEDPLRPSTHERIDMGLQRLVPRAHSRVPNDRHGRSLSELDVVGADRQRSIVPNRPGARRGSTRVYRGSNPSRVLEGRVLVARAAASGSGVEWPAIFMNPASVPPCSATEVSADRLPGMHERDQDKFIALVRHLFSQPQEPVVNNDLPLETPVDFNWSDPTGGVFRLRLYIAPHAVLIVKQQAAAPSSPWVAEQRLLVHGDEAVSIARQVERLLGQ